VQFALEVEAAGPAASFIAVNQTWDQGWRARVDGILAPVVRTDISLSGVLVPPGQHRVEFEYFDDALAAGLACPWWRRWLAWQWYCWIDGADLELRKTSLPVRTVMKALDAQQPLAEN